MSEEEAQVFRGGHAVETAINEHSARKKKKPVKKSSKSSTKKAVA